jgi:hypothetical protein
MNTLEFFQEILPDEGTHFLAIFEPGYDYPFHRAYGSLNELASAVEWYEANRPEVTIYHTCAAYKAPFQEIDGKKTYRKSVNWLSAKSFWLDLDCGPTKGIPDSKGKIQGYLTKKLALLAVKDFLDQTKLPPPLVIDSGNGIHLYWPLTKAIPPEKWRLVANAFEAVVKHHGLIADASRTTDFSSVLRPVGSFHKKGEPRQVTAKNKVNKISPQDFLAIIQTQVKNNQLVVEKVYSKQEPEERDELEAFGSEYDSKTPRSAEKVAQHCQQVAMMRDTQGDVGYDHWRGVIGIIKFCEEGIDLARDWSARRAETGHSQLDVDTRYNTWDARPTSCGYFDKCNPGGCNGCPSQGKVGSPITLGKIIVEPEASVVEAEIDGKLMEVEIPEFPPKFTRNGSIMIRQMEDKDGLVHEFPFSPNLFYPIYRVRKEDGTYSLRMRLHLPNNKTREFDLETKALSSPQKLAEALSQYELLGSNSKDANMHMNAYMKDFLEKLKAEAEEMNTLVSYGWNADMNAFLLGDRLYHADGSVRKVLVGGMAKDFLPAFVNRGTAEGYAKGIDFLYNRKGMQPMQYAVASAFGSVLTPLADSQYKGLIMSLAGGDSGKGKTTVCMAGLYGFGDAQQMQIAGNKGGTLNARYGMISTFKNVPLLMDELTHMEPEQVSELSYQISMGKEKLRQQVKGNVVGFATPRSFEASVYGTSNTGLHGKVADFQDNAQAEAVRIIEINIDRYPATKLDPAEVEPVRKTIERNAGAAGDEYIKYVVTNLDDITNDIAIASKKLQAEIPDSKYRFWRWHAACTLTAVKIMNKLGICGFDYDHLYSFTVEMFTQMAEAVAAENTLTPEEALNKVISTLSPRIIVTDEYRDARDGRGPEYVRIQGTPAGRCINGSSNAKDDVVSGKLFICRKEFIAAVKSIRAEPETVLEYAKKIGVYVPYASKFTIGRGTNIKTGNTNVICIDQVKLESIDETAPKLTLHSSGKQPTGKTAKK